MTGLVAGGGLFFLALTGLPWSIWWGDQFRAWTNAAGLGQPAALWANKPVSNVPMGEMLTTAGWTMQDAPVPKSAVGGAAQGIGIDSAAQILARLGMPHGYELSLPVGPTGVYAAAALPPRCDPPTDGLAGPVHRQSHSSTCISPTSARSRGRCSTA